MAELQFDALTHTYTVGGQVIPSVTQIIRPLYDFSAIPPQVLAQKAKLGTAVHLATELHDAGTLDESSVHPAVRPYLDAWVKFCDDTGIVMCGSEQRLYHASLGYAGTLDRTGLVDGDSWILDIKTTAQLSAAVGIQLAAYLHALQAGDPTILTMQRRAVQLRPDGNYRLSKQYTDASDLTCFLALLGVHKWRTLHE